ncbi:MAG: NUDIX domain-containing protein [Microgenomates group bacterium]
MKAGIDYIGISVGALIFNKEGKILLCKRSQQAKNERGCWEAPGGAVEFGETLEHAIIREMKEELGIELEIQKQLPAADHIIPDDHQHWVPTSFICRIKNNKVPKIMEPTKCDAIGWFALDDLPKPLSIITQIDIKKYHTLEDVETMREHEVFNVGVKLLLKNKQGKYLVLLKDKNECVRDKVKVHWDIPGGRVNKGEAMDKTLTREIEEEIGITMYKINALLGVTVSNFANKFTGNKLLLAVYAGALIKKEEIILNKEHTEYRWVSKNEAMSLLADKYPKTFLKTILT